MEDEFKNIINTIWQKTSSMSTDELKAIRKRYDEIVNSSTPEQIFSWSIAAAIDAFNATGCGTNKPTACWPNNPTSGGTNYVRTNA